MDVITEAIHHGIIAMSLNQIERHPIVGRLYGPESFLIKHGTLNRELTENGLRDIHRHS